MYLSEQNEFLNLLSRSIGAVFGLSLPCNISTEMTVKIHLAKCVFNFAVQNTKNLHLRSIYLELLHFFCF